MCQVRARYVYLIDDCMVLRGIRLITLNFSRYGKQWASWRATGPESPNAKTHKVELGEQEGIASIKGIWRKPDKESKDANMAGWIEQITLVTTSGVTHGPYGDEGAPVQGTNRYKKKCCSIPKIKKSDTGTWSHLLWKAPYSPTCQGAQQKGTCTLLFIGLFLPLLMMMILAHVAMITMMCLMRRTTMCHQNTSFHNSRSSLVWELSRLKGPHITMI